MRARSSCFFCFSFFRDCNCKVLFHFFYLEFRNTTGQGVFLVLHLMYGQLFSRQSLLILRVIRFVFVTREIQIIFPAFQKEFICMLCQLR